MAVVRILVDGTALLQQWPALAPGKPRHSEVAREELINRLLHYHDTTGIPIMVIFTGPDLGPFPSTPDLEVVYTQNLRSADQLLEKAATRLKARGEVLAVKDSSGQRGGAVTSCAEFIQTLENTYSELEENITRYNQTERSKFTSGLIL
jgi:predicted RNA-binding protein with PIN domain